MRRSVRTKPRAVLALQTLEGREVPAGNVVASLSAAGVLTLVGDDAGNAITVRVTGTSLTVTGNAGTTVNGRASVAALAAVRGVQATMNGGDDAVRIDPTANFLVPGPVTANLGAGNNTLSLRTTGRLALGSLGVTGGAGNDSVGVAGGFGTGSAISGTTQINLGFGADVLALRRFAAGGAVSVTTGDGADTLTINAASFQSTFLADLGAGNDALRIAQQTGSPTPVEFRAAVTVRAGTGDDTLLLGRAVTAGGDANSRVTFNGGTMEGGAGFNFFDTVRTRRTGSVFLLGWA